MVSCHPGGGGIGQKLGYVGTVKQGMVSFHPRGFRGKNLGYPGPNSREHPWNFFQNFSFFFFFFFFWRVPVGHGYSAYARHSRMIFTPSFLSPAFLLVVVPQIRDHIVPGSSPPLPTTRTVRALQFFIARRFQLFLPSSTRVES